MAAYATVTSTPTPWRVEITDGVHRWHADEPASVGGGDTGPTPAQMVCGALAACTTITIQMYAQRKKWPVTAIEVTVTKDARGKPADGAAELDRQIRIDGALDADQRARLLEVANKCPTHKLLSGPIRIATQLA
ncbi:MAG: OsmC family protein [Gammaproteobacteria bacterium]